MFARVARIAVRERAFPESVPPIPLVSSVSSRVGLSEPAPQRQKLGFKSKTEAYGNCRLQLEQIQATNWAASASQEAAAAARVLAHFMHGQKQPI